MRAKERCSSPRMPLPLWKLGVRKRKESGERERRAGAEGRGKRVESIEKLLNPKNVLKHKTEKVGNNLSLKLEPIYSPSHSHPLSFLPSFWIVFAWITPFSFSSRHAFWQSHHGNREPQEDSVHCSPAGHPPGPRSSRAGEQEDEFGIKGAFIISVSAKALIPTKSRRMGS